MAKTLEELKEAINNVIVENNKGEITAKSLNTLLTDMADTLSELGGGGGQFDLYATITPNKNSESSDEPEVIISTTDEQKELNKIVYDKIANDERAPLVLHVNDINSGEGFPYSINISGTCIYVMFFKDIKEDIIKGISSTGLLQFMSYSAEAFRGFFFLLDNGDIVSIG